MPSWERKKKGGAFLSLPSSSSLPFPSNKHILRSCCVLEGGHPQASSGRLDLVTFKCSHDSECIGFFILCVVQGQDISPTQWLEGGHRQSRTCRWKIGEGPGRKWSYVVRSAKEEHIGRGAAELRGCFCFVLFFTQCVLIFLQRLWCKGALVLFLGAMKLWCS